MLKGPTVIIITEGAGSARLVIETNEWLQVRVAAGNLFSPGSAFCADSYFSICSTPVLLK